MKILRIITFLFLILGIFVSACTPPQAPGAPANPGANSANSGGQTASTVSGAVEIWHFWGSPVRRTALRRLIAICQEQLPNIQISETFKPFGDIWTANIAAVAAGTGMPGVIVENRPLLPQRARDQIDTNLQTYIDRDKFDTSVFWPFTWQETLYENNSYGIPFETDVRVLIWNKQAFADAGLDPEKPPTTWDELKTYADALDIKNDDGSYKRIGFFPLWQAGVDFWARTNGWQQVVDGKPNYNDPAFIETLQWVKGWVDRYGGWQNIQNYAASYASPPNDLFMSGATPMIVDVAGYLSQLNLYRPQAVHPDGSRENMTWGVSYIPYKKAQADWSGGFALSIPKGYANPDAAWEVIKCLSSSQSQESWTRDTLAIPTNQTLTNSAVLNADPFWGQIMEIMKTSQGSTYVPQYPNFTQEADTRFEKVWTGELTPEQMAQETQKAIDDTMAKAGG
ncbi:MAG: ABC transporter substrate-binding protein [Caldilineaceae bacterium]